MLHVTTLPISEDYHLLFCVLYNAVLENHSVQWGEAGSITSSRRYNCKVTAHRQDRYVLKSYVKTAIYRFMLYAF